MPWPVVVGSLFLAAGVWLLLTALAHRARRLALLRDCVRTAGRVVRHDDTTTDGDIQATQAPVVRYVAPGGRSHVLALPPRRDVSALPVGARVPVFYQRGDPANAVHVRRTWDVNLACLLNLLPILIGAAIFLTVYQQTGR